jgi:hypothetical protein
VVLSGRALLEWEKTLQLIGVLGIAYSIYWRVQSYTSMEEVKADIRWDPQVFHSRCQLRGGRLLQGALIAMYRVAGRNASVQLFGAKVHMRGELV